jgi:hypothetical protein
MAAYDLIPKPEVRCTCGPRLRCTHGQPAPAIPGSPKARTGPSRPQPTPLPGDGPTENPKG